ncbi:MAG TPA: phosphate acetyltransferase [Elusimicrobiota bacterium]|jgi:phosphate acetyltransferase|nr:phosphate acetyltransferase [Elusimicrobiota bacterium]
MSDHDILKKIWEMARKTPRRLVLPEGDEPRTVQAAAILARERLAKPILLAKPEAARAAARKHGADLSQVEIVDPAADPRRNGYAAQYYELRKHKGHTEEEVAKLMLDPLVFGTMMLHNNDVEGFLSGADHATADTIRPALQIIKPAPGVRTISSFFILIVPNCEFGEKGVLLVGDCAINIDPPAVKLAGIAVSTARMAKVLCGFEPRVAMLSFSTKGSAEHELVDKVREAVRIAKEKNPELAIDGELQADAALVPDVGGRKAPGSPVAGKANVLIFPDLQSANIGYKLVQRLAKAEAVGPILQGFAKPVNDLSRGASVSDIVHLGAITVLQADPALRGEAAAAKAA